MDHLTPYYRKEGILMMKERRILIILLAGHKVWTTMSPRYLYLGMTLMRSIHAYGTRNASLAFQVPCQRTARMGGSFIGTFVRNYNCLPGDIKENFRKPKIFKYHLDRYNSVR
jgi:hypothetical protein